MKIRGTLIQGALALVGLGAAYATWQRVPEKAAGEVVVLEATKNDVEKVRFEDDKGWVELARSGKGDDAAVWVTLSAREVTPPKGHDKPGDKSADKAPEKQPERQVRGNEAAGHLLDGLAPLKASRALGVVEAAKLKEFGLAPQDPPDGGVAPAFRKRSLTITVRGDVRTFSIGTPPGLFATYLKDDRDGRVYLLGGSLVTDLESANTRMVDRTLHAFKAGDFDALTVEAGGKSRELVVLPGETPTVVRLAAKKSADKPDETAKNWHDKLFRAFPSDVLGKGEKPAAGEPQPVLKVSYFNRGQPKGFIEVGKLMVTTPAKPNPRDPKAPLPPPSPQPEFWARSEHTAGWVKLGYGTEDLVKEAEKIAATE